MENADWGWVVHIGRFCEYFVLFVMIVVSMVVVMVVLAAITAHFGGFFVFFYEILNKIYLCYFYCINYEAAFKTKSKHPRLSALLQGTSKRRDRVPTTAKREKPQFINWTHNRP